MNEQIDNIIVAEEKDVTPRDLLKLAQCILLTISILFIIGIVSEYLMPNHGIFDACKTIFPPIATSVIGFYFGKSN
jgi:hypothetical protein